MCASCLRAVCERVFVLSESITSIFAFSNSLLHPSAHTLLSARLPLYDSFSRVESFPGFLLQSASDHLQAAGRRA